MMLIYAVGRTEAKSLSIPPRLSPVGSVCLLPAQFRLRLKPARRLANTLACGVAAQALGGNGVGKSALGAYDGVEWFGRCCPLKLATMGRQSS